jgi:hypothetical protein
MGANDRRQRFIGGEAPDSSADPAVKGFVIKGNILDLPAKVGKPHAPNHL